MTKDAAARIEKANAQKMAVKRRKNRSSPDRNVRLTKTIRSGSPELPNTSGICDEELDLWSDINNPNNDADMDDRADAHNLNNEACLGD